MMIGWDVLLQGFIGAVVGALLTVVFTALLSRRPLPQILWYLQSSEWLSQSVKEAEGKLEVTYEGEAAKDVFLCQIRFANLSEEVIPEPQVAVRLHEPSRILRAAAQVQPQRAMTGDADSPCAVYRNAEQPNTVTIKLNRLLPYRTNDELLVLDLVCDGSLESLEVVGSGAMPTGRPWLLRETFSADFSTPEKGQRIAMLGTIAWWMHLLTILAGLYLFIRIYVVGSVIDSNWLRSVAVEPATWLLSVWILALPVWVIIYWVKNHMHGRVRIIFTQYTIVATAGKRGTRTRLRF